MADPAHPDRVLESLDNRLLTDNFIKNLGPKFSGDDLVFHLGKTNGNKVRGKLRHIGLPNTVASFRTWRGFQAPIAQPPKACATGGRSRLAERVGFEPTVELPPHTLSKRAP